MCRRLAVILVAILLECGGSTPLCVLGEPPQSKDPSIQSGVEPPHSKQPRYTGWLDGARADTPDASYRYGDPLWLRDVLSEPDARADLPSGAVARFPGPGLRQVTCHFGAAFSPDGRIVATEGYVRGVRLLDITAGKDLRQFTQRGRLFAATFSPDGKIFACSGDRTPELWDVATGNLLRSLNIKDGIVFSLAFSPDGKTLASGDSRGSIHLWDVATGRQIRELAGHYGQIQSVAFSPDGKVLASGGITIRLWEVATGAELHHLVGHEETVFAVAFSPDGKILASASRDGTLRLWRPALGKGARIMQRQKPWIQSVAFSRDGRLLASGDVDGTICLWEVATGQEVHRFHGHDPWVLNVAFAPDGRTFASGSLGGAVVIWSLHAALATPVGLDDCWAALAGHDAERAYGALWSLADCPAESIPFVKKRLLPAQSPDEHIVRRLLADLDCDQFTVREAASCELAMLGYEIEWILLETAEQTRSAEVRRRALLLLDALPFERPAEVLQQSRAVQFLELLGSAEARKLLHELAQGAPLARLTQEAKASLERLAKRPVN